MGSVFVLLFDLYILCLCWIFMVFLVGSIISGFLRGMVGFL